jgi:YesN/AraC family two-component response regulator
MQMTTLYQHFELEICDLELWRRRPLVYHFFEIVHVLEGSGLREVNRNKSPFYKDNIFLFTPLDCRGFESEQPTRFCSIRFSEVFLSQYKEAAALNKVIARMKQLEYIFSHHNRFEQLLIRNEHDCKTVKSLLESIIDEHARKPAHYEENLQHLVTLILNILSRNVSTESLPVQTEAETEPLINKMLNHIHTHISAPDKLRIDYMASAFNLSSNYVSEYFRKFTTESLQHYISQYRLLLVKQRLKHSDMTIAQIADELGFADESHLSKQFKKYNGNSPLQFKKAIKRFS